MSEVPSGWRRIELKNCGTWLSGGTPATEEPRFWGGGIPWISAASLKNFKITDSDRRVTRAGSMAGTRMVDAGSVLFVVRGMSLKSEFRVGVSQRCLAFGQDCKAILPHRGIDATFLGLALKARERDILAIVDEAGHGTGRLPTDLLAKLEIDVPELQEQRRIVEILDSADAQTAATDRVLHKLENQRRGFIEASLSGDSAHAEQVPLGSVLRRIDAGWSPLCAERPPAPGEWGVLKVSAVTSGRFNWRESKTLLEGFRPRQELQVGEGDLLICRANGVASLVGVVALVKGAPARLILSDKTLRLVPDAAKIDLRYLALVLSSRHVRHQIDGLLSGSSGQKNISQRSLASISVALPDLDRQKSVASVVSAMDSMLELEQAVRERLLDQKKGLTDNLLTGRVRV